jgi:hypothetical protein
VNVEYRLNGDGGTWTDAFLTGTALDPATPPTVIPGNDQHVGGTMVRIGPVQENDFITLMSPSSTSDTLGKDARLWVFNPVKGYVGSDGSDAYGNPWSAPLSRPWVGGFQGVPSETYALLSLGAPKRTSSDYGIAGWVEKYFDLVHNPVSVTAESLSHSGIGQTNFRRSGECRSVSSLPVGHYQWILSVATTKPVGSPTYKTLDPSPQGTPNELAFAATIYRGTEIMTRRYVTRGAIGTRFPYATKISLELVVPDEPKYADAEYSVCFDEIAPWLSIVGNSEIVRNQDSGELRVATANIEYTTDDGDLLQSEPEMTNAIDLLARSADYPGDGRVLYKDSRGRWRFDADLVNFNEILWRGGTESTQNNLVARLTANTGYNVWNAHSAPSRFCPAFCEDRMGILIENARATPNGTWCDGTRCDGTPISREPDEIFDAACEGAGLDVNADVSERHACRTIDDVESDDFIFVMRSAVSRVDGAASGGHVGAPVMVVHTYYDSDTDDAGNRLEQATRVRDVLVNLLALDPYGFNTAGSNNLLHAGNRIIVLGDQNMANTNNSEVNSELEMFRGAFGYAVDVSMAATDGNGDLARAMDTHYGCLPLMDARMLSVEIEPPFVTRETWFSDPVAGPNGTVFPALGYRLPGLKDLDLHSVDRHVSELFHPWWNSTETTYESYRPVGGDRNDVVLLVGLGWAEDDPVRHYLVPSVLELTEMMEPNPNAGRNRYGEIEHGGIDIRRYCDRPDYVHGSAGDSYEPEFTNVCGVHDDATKQIVYQSDHRPIGARLRVRF